MRILEGEKCIYARAVQLAVNKLNILNVAALCQNRSQNAARRKIQLRAKYSQLRDRLGHLDLQLEARQTGHFQLVQRPDIQVRELFRYLFVKL